MFASRRFALLKQRGRLVPLARVVGELVKHRVHRRPLTVQPDTQPALEAPYDLDLVLCSAVARLSRRLGRTLQLTCLEQAALCHRVLRHQGHAVRLRWAMSAESSGPFAHAFVAPEGSDVPLDGSRLPARFVVFAQPLKLTERSREDG